jgi:hypothetical protein
MDQSVGERIVLGIECFAVTSCSQTLRLPGGIEHVL